MTCRKTQLELNDVLKAIGEEASWATIVADALNFDRDGFALDAAAVPPERAWTSSLSIGPDAVEGHPANPDGSAAREKIRPQLPEILLPTANLVRLQQRVHLCPLHSGPADGLGFIFFMTPFDWATAPRETSLQRAVAGHLAAGRRWRSGGMYLPMNEIPL